MDEWRRRARMLKAETYALYLAYRDPRVSWYARLCLALVVGYALSPIDLIPDFIPVLGYLDDLVLLPLGIALAIKMIPEPVLAECRERSQLEMAQKGPTNRTAAAVILLIWIGLAALLMACWVKSVR
jgi:uncharacterized membrane protein YkvA (DUF1232 family)